MTFAPVIQVSLKEGLSLTETQTALSDIRKTAGVFHVSFNRAAKDNRHLSVTIENWDVETAATAIKKIKNVSDIQF